jgi:uncharacterized protein YuzE
MRPVNNHFPPTPSDRALRITHDPRTRVAYIHLVDRSVSGGSHRSVQALGDHVVFDLDKADRVLGIEFLDTRHLHPATLAEAEKPPRRPEEILDETDLRVHSACLGHREAQEALYVEYHRVLVDEAREVLGKHRTQDAQDVVQETWEEMIAGRCRFPIIRGAGVAWLRRLVRSRAAEIVRRGGAR